MNKIKKIKATPRTASWCDGVPIAPCGSTSWCDRRAWDARDARGLPISRARDECAARISCATGAASRTRCASRAHLACDGRCVVREMRAALHAACAHLTHMHLQHHTTNNNDIPNNNKNPNNNNNSNNINNINNNKNGNNNSPRVFNFSRPGLKCCRSTPPPTIYTTSGDEILVRGGGICLRETWEWWGQFRPQFGDLANVDRKKFEGLKLKNA